MATMSKTGRGPENSEYYRTWPNSADSNLHVTYSPAFIKRDPGSKIQSEIGHGKWIILDVRATNVASVPSENPRRGVGYSPPGTINTWSQSYI